MKIKLLLVIPILYLTSAFLSYCRAQAYRIRLVNMIPADQSCETNHDTEPNIAVNPANPNIIVASAFTFSPNRFANGRQNCDEFPCGEGTTSTHVHESLVTCRAPLYFSTDGGRSWVLKDVLPSNNGITHDITLSFSESGYLYVAMLKGCEYVPADSEQNIMKGFMIFRSPGQLNTPEAIRRLLDMRIINDDLLGIMYDQPWIVARNVESSNLEIAGEHVYVGVNNFSAAGSQPTREMYGRTATVMVYNEAVSSSIIPTLIETRTQRDKNPAGVRLATHNSGKVYAIFYRSHDRRLTPPPRELCDVILVRDDNFAIKAPRFGALQSGNGSEIARAVTLPLFYLRASDPYRPSMFVADPLGKLGHNRVGGSDLAVAVDPNNENHVFVAWGSVDKVNRDDSCYCLHFRHNIKGGDEDWLPLHDSLTVINQALNPAIAITENRRVGLLYQQLVDGWWETHFVIGRINDDDDFELIQKQILSRFPDDDIDDYKGHATLSDYLDLQAVGNVFYGVFAAINTPDPTDRTVEPARFPTVRPNYYRNNPISLVAGNNRSIDPFFFKVEPINLSPLTDADNNVIRFADPWVSSDQPFAPAETNMKNTGGTIIFPMTILYERSFVGKIVKTKTSFPYFHLFLENLDRNEFDIKIVSADGINPEQELNKTKNGYTLSFRTSKANYDNQKGLHDLQLLLIPKAEQSIKKETVLKYRLEASDYPFKEFIENYK